MPYANNKGADQPAHLHSLISTFVVRCLDSIILRFYIWNLKPLPSFCGYIGQSESTLGANPEDRFSHDEAHSCECWLCPQLKLCMQSIRWLQLKLWYKLISLCMHYLSTIKTLTKKQSVKMAKFEKLPFGQEVFLWHQPSSCKCSMCLHCVCKVSAGFSKSSGISWFPHSCTIRALKLRLTKPH